MSQYAVGTIVVALLAAAAEVGLSVATTSAAPPPVPWLVFLMAFLVGPLAFLALLAWRRRAHPGRARLVLVATVLAAAAGVGVLGTDYFFSRTDPNRRVLGGNPVILPLLQWVAALAVWGGLEVAERRGKRAATPPQEKKA
jgi:crotonobetainyl-CoA:carnitine CoA-transferase CaiB-like acyl-CoA transferase